MTYIVWSSHFCSQKYIISNLN